MVRVSISGAVLLAALPTLAFAGDAKGDWARDDGKAKVRIGPCGDALCGAISWLRDPKTDPGKVGQQVFFDMKPKSDNVWTGSGLQSGGRQDLFGQNDAVGRPSGDGRLCVRRAHLQVSQLDAGEVRRGPPPHHRSQPGMVRASGLRNRRLRAAASFR